MVRKAGGGREEKRTVVEELQGILVSTEESLILPVHIAVAPLGAQFSVRVYAWVDELDDAVEVNRVPHCQLQNVSIAHIKKVSDLLRRGK